MRISLGENPNKERIDLVACCMSVEELFGFELEWNEIAALRHYLRCFDGEQKRNPSSESYPGWFWFLVDYFELDLYELGKTGITIIEAGGELSKEYGLGLINGLEDEISPIHKKFKEYCRRNADNWRAERGMI